MSTDIILHTEIKRLSLRPGLNYAWEIFFGKPLLKQRFLLYLVEVYHYVKHTCPLMTRALPQARDNFPAYHQYLTRHIAEENGHEKWVLSDVEKLGLNRQAVMDSTPLRQTINLVATQLYILESRTPEAYLGYIYMMEGNTADQQRLDELCKQLGIAPHCLSALYQHAKIDIEFHIKDLRDWMAQNLDDSVKGDAILENMDRTAGNLVDLVFALADLDDNELLSRLAPLTNSAKISSTGETHLALADADMF